MQTPHPIFVIPVYWYRLWPSGSGRSGGFAGADRLGLIGAPEVLDDQPRHARVDGQGHVPDPVDQDIGGVQVWVLATSDPDGYHELVEVGVDGQDRGSTVWRSLLELAQ